MSQKGLAPVHFCLIWHVLLSLQMRWLEFFFTWEPIGCKVRTVLANTFTSFGAAAASNERASRSALVDESMEPRAEADALKTRPKHHGQNLQFLLGVLSPDGDLSVILGAR